jgi:PAS domain S-box-containing protein
MVGPDGEAGWERLFWLVFGRTSNPVILLDDSRTIIQVNDAALALFGGAREDLVGSSMADSIRPAERAVAEAEWQDFLRPGSGEYCGTRALVRADGSEIEVEFAARLAQVDGRRLAIYVALQQAGDPREAGTPIHGLPLTVREREVVTLIALGLDTAEIAQELHISTETVRTHVRNAMSRLGAHTRAQLVAIAISTEDAFHIPHLEGGRRGRGFG